MRDYCQKKNRMSIFNIFKSKDIDPTTKEDQLIPWIQLNRLEQLNEIVEISKHTPVVIFKNSSTCGVSRAVLRGFERDYAIDEGKIKLYFLDLLAFRNVSNEIAFKFQVIHQSPQLLVIKNGVAVHHASHHMIDTSDLTPYIF